jgi:hypothetical protein
MAGILRLLNGIALNACGSIQCAALLLKKLPSTNLIHPSHVLFISCYLVWFL